MNFKKSLYDTYKNIAEKVIPDLNNHDFISSGCLTKDEFKQTGDYLISQHNKWYWNKDKTMLSLDYNPVKKILFDEYDDKEDFNEDKYKLNICENTETNSTPVINKPLSKPHNEDDDEYDFSDFEIENDGDDGFIQDESIINDTHYYDISITYDSYYRTPRIWFFGTDRGRIPLNTSEIFSDFSVEHMKVSATLENHPITNLNSVSVHPCKHVDAMKKMFKFALEQNKDIKIEHYLLHFLKFVSCIIPHMCFDFLKV